MPDCQSNVETLKKVISLCEFTTVPKKNPNLVIKKSLVDTCKHQISMSTECTHGWQNSRYKNPQLVTQQCFSASFGLMFCIFSPCVINNLLQIEESCCEKESAGLL